MKQKRGYTLIELMVVMAIIAILSVLIVGAIQMANRASKESQNRGNMKTIETALEAYAARNNGSYCPIKDGAGVTQQDCATGLSFSALATELRDSGYLSDTLGTACSTLATPPANYREGGGFVDLSSTTFTVYAAGSNCLASTASYLQKVTH